MRPWYANITAGNAMHTFVLNATSSVEWIYSGCVWETNQRSFIPLRWRVLFFSRSKSKQYKSRLSFIFGHVWSCWKGMSHGHRVNISTVMIAFHASHTFFCVPSLMMSRKSKKLLPCHKHLCIYTPVDSKMCLYCWLNNYQHKLDCISVPFP